jgi:hypothetical protein
MIKNTIILSSEVYLPHSVAFIIALLRKGTFEHMAATTWSNEKNIELNVLQRNTELKINYYNNSTAYGNIYAEKSDNKKLTFAFT